MSSPAAGRAVAPTPRRSAPFTLEPGFHPESGLWFYGNIKLLHGKLAHLPAAAGPELPSPKVLDELEHACERLVLEGSVLVCGVHSPAHQRTALVPLRWGAPRIVVFSGGFHHHLGPSLTEEPFRAARLWRYQWDRLTDLAVSRRAPEKLPTFASHNPTVDRLIEAVATRDLPALQGPNGSLSPLEDRDQ